MRFTIVMPSRLAVYAGAAKNREDKLLRAVSSCLNQTFRDFEIIVIADGCEQTVKILEDIENEKLRLFKISHHKLWSGYPRNKGIEEARGQYLIYLDNDDLYGKNHLQIINDSLNGYDWVWFNDIRFKTQGQFWYENQCDIRIVGRHGTSNICHRNLPGVRWDEEGRYAHDYHFVRKLLKFGNHTKIQTPEYYVCHIPGTKISGGYDL
jgi:glycosyltransferase involved in cell wall biosynthesis